MSELAITGKLVKILEKETGTSKSGKDWESQSIVIDTGDQYNPLVCFKFFGKNAAKLEGLNINSQVEVGFNVSSREFNGKYYHSLDGWRIKVLDNATNENIEKLKEEMDLTPFGDDQDDGLPY